MADPRYVTLEQAKGQVVVDEDVDIHDERLTRLIVAGELWAEEFLNRPLGELVAETGGDELREDVVSAILLHVEFEFDPDAQKDKTIEAAQRLLWPHRIALGI